MKKGKILFTDLDGTLLADDGSISPENKRAIGRMLANGDHIVLSTGRALSSGEKIAKRLGLIAPGCYMIAFNGSVLYDCYKKEILYKKAIPLPLVCRLFEKAHKAGLHIQTYDKTYVLAIEHTKELDYYLERTGMEYRLLPDISALAEEPCKVLLVSLKSRAELETFQRENGLWTKEELSSFFSSDKYLEYCPVKVNKGAAIQELCGILDIPTECAVAAGDECNDISMLHAAGIGVAVKNAVPQAKAAADYITKRDNNHAAIAEVIEKFFF